MPARVRGFREYTFRRWDSLVARLHNFPPKWAFRGQPDEKPLSTTFERTCDDLQVRHGARREIEKQLILDFRRRCGTEDRALILEDTLFCMALMQHHGAPTRLLDWTYSPFVASFFALEDDEASVIWCLNTGWCREKASGVAERVSLRAFEERRAESSFLNCYFDKPTPFVLPENAYALNTRAAAQQGLFLCPGDIESTFEDNLRAVDEWDEYGAVQIVRMNFSRQERIRALRALYRMNISRASLFPGLDGFAQSLRQRMLFSLEGPHSVKGNA
jgi:hypothetical protein